MKTKTIRKKGKKPITFHPGGLHKSLHVPAGKPIPKGKFEEAARGLFGPKAKRQALFKRNVLVGRK